MTTERAKETALEIVFLSAVANFACINDVSLRRLSAWNQIPFGSSCAS